MPDALRRLVSARKQRFYDPSLKIELDLIYLTDNLILMGYPASGLQSLYRNERWAAARFLRMRHGMDNWRVYNLCPRSEASYDAEKVFGDWGAGGSGGGVSRYPFPDHHVPPLSLIPLFVADITSWIEGGDDSPAQLSSNEKKKEGREQKQRTAVIHCKAGKGRSGTMAICYLLTLKDMPEPPSDPRNQSGWKAPKGPNENQKMLEGSSKNSYGGQANDEETKAKGSDAAITHNGRLETSPSQSSAEASALSNFPPMFPLERVTSRAQTFQDTSAHSLLSPPKASGSNAMAAADARDENDRRLGMITTRNRSASFLKLPPLSPSSKHRVCQDGQTLQRQKSSQLEGRDGHQRDSLDAVEHVAERLKAVLEMHTKQRMKPDKPKKKKGEAAMTSMSSSPEVDKQAKRKSSFSKIKAKFSRKELNRHNNEDEPPLPSNTAVGSMPPPSSLHFPGRTSRQASAAASSMLSLNTNAGIDDSLLSDSGFLHSRSFSSDMHLHLAPPKRGDGAAGRMRRASATGVLGVQSAGRSADNLASTATRGWEKASAASSPHLPFAQAAVSTAEDNAASEAGDETQRGKILTHSTSGSHFLPSAYAHELGQPQRSEEDEEEPPRYGVSIPSQRRWIGYWARILALNDPRAVLRSHMPRDRRQVVITRISVDRLLQLKTASFSSKGAQPGSMKASKVEKLFPNSDSLSVHLGRYGDGLVKRLETWERSARKRHKAFGVHDPSSSSYDLDLPPGTGAGEGKEEDAEGKASRLAALEQKCAWGINVDAEADFARSFDWGKSKSENKIGWFAKLEESERRVLERDEYPESLDAKVRRRLQESSKDLVRYTFLPSSEGNQRRVEVPPRRSSISGTASPEKLSPAVQKSSKKQDGVNALPPPASEAYAPKPFSRVHGLPVDADRELNVKILLGRTGGAHALLPDITAAGWAWFIPSFEDPEGLGPKEGQRTVLRFEKGEVDFCKDAMGVVGMEVEWAWTGISGIEDEE